jgi:hypothetical protein
MASKCEQAWHSYEQDKPIHIPSDRWVNDVSSPSSLGIEFVSWLWSVQIEWPANVSKHNIHTNKKNHPRTEIQLSQPQKFCEFARNGTRELIMICSNRMARKCEQAWHPYKKDKPIHVPSHSSVNDVSSPSSLGIWPVSWLYSDGTEWQGTVSKRGIHKNEINQSTYRNPDRSTTSVLRVRSEWNLWVDSHLFK